ncbi:MAG TPA: LD-carboxypeptidase, partial [Thermoanaerobaculia bacterium]|nr:LD-carboxypeptidase [Thermoanaerobaculia bacterium]
MTNLVIPRRLQPDARLGVAAVSGPVDSDRLVRGIRFLASKGYEVREASNLRSSRSFFAGADDERARGYR